MEKLNLPETAAHHSIALTGGFFGIYALLLRSENFGSSETANLIYLFCRRTGGRLAEVWDPAGCAVCLCGRPGVCHADREAL